MLEDAVASPRAVVGVRAPARVACVAATVIVSYIVELATDKTPAEPVAFTVIVIVSVTAPAIPEPAAVSGAYVTVTVPAVGVFTTTAPVVFEFAATLAERTPAAGVTAAVDPDR